uniref:7TM GPCR serpentine receptor class x (Srx) domain-containing protein n=1 Tax=Panagrellus redivivus TaxID=6233 RepID=A0A7E4VQG4_PANRE
MHEFRHCLCMLCIFDAIFGFFVGIVLIVSFQPPALAGVLKGPVIMFCYHYLGYNFCKVLVCVAFFAIAEILYFQNVAMRIRYLTINPSKRCYDWYSSVYGFIFIYTSAFIACGIVGVAIFLLMHDENDIPSVVTSYPNYTTIFVDYVPGENIVMAADPKSPIWYFIFVYVSIATLYCEGNSYASFFMARRLLKKHASSFSVNPSGFYRLPDITASNANYVRLAYDKITK